ncbi:hypothetical protein V6N13_008761 [Hibiscus sabdariffa]|uniref:Uncharacterized protein n=1 Tax=Hibiscus sabdariffa TaxID=183260 RepID=A0ABR2ECW2_9ROSI
MFYGLKLKLKLEWQLFLEPGRYCSNYYSEFAEPIEVCDWCQSEERNSRHGSSSKKSSAGNGSEIIVKRSQYSGDKIKQQNRDESSGDHKGKSSGSPSPRPTTRRKCEYQCRRRSPVGISMGLRFVLSPAKGCPYISLGFVESVDDENSMHLNCLHFGQRIHCRHLQIHSSKAFNCEVPHHQFFKAKTQ